MPLYMDVHRNIDATPEEIEAAHHSDVAIQEKYGVQYLKYWVNQKDKTIFCLVEAPNAEACVEVHKQAHGLLADQIIEVETNIVDAFLGGESQSVIGTAMKREGGLDPAYRIILFTDLVDSTSLTQRLGDAEAMGVLRAHDAIVRKALSATGGREVKHTGDGIMASFLSAAGAIACAVAIQKGVKVHNEAHNEGARDHALQVRIGMSAGEPVAENEDLFGAAVQIARRVCDRAEGGRVYVANVVREMCVGKPFRFEDLGMAELKGFDAPVRLHEVVWA
ncbi:MAG TPA: nickel-binding protein [Gemmatimonadota bacterium]|nr:nickel-binding protein [Gemmatimonadota bacterium]